MKYSKTKNGIILIQKVANEFFEYAVKDLELPRRPGLFIVESQKSIKNPNLYGAVNYKVNSIYIFYKNILHHCLMEEDDEKFNEMITSITATTVLYELRHKWHYDTKYLMKRGKTPYYFYSNVRRICPKIWVLLEKDAEEYTNKIINEIHGNIKTCISS